MKVGDATCRTRGRSDTVVPLRNLRSECESEAFLMAVYMAMYSHTLQAFHNIIQFSRLNTAI